MGLKKFSVTPSRNWLSFFFLRFTFLLSLFLKSKSCQALFCFFFPATTHAAEILPSALWNCNLLFLFLSVIIQSPYSRNPFTFWTTFVIPFFLSFPVPDSSACQTFRCIQSPEDLVKMEILLQTSWVGPKILHFDQSQVLLWVLGPRFG